MSPSNLNLNEMKKYSLYIITLLFGLTLTSCEDMFGGFLDKEASNELTQSDVFGDWSQMEEFHYDTYNFLRHGAYRINYSWLDSATDLAETSYGTAGTRTSLNIGNYYGDGGANELTAPWEHYYRAIRKCNYIVTTIDSVPAPIDLSTELYETRKAQYVAEARFLRAFFYWEMFLRYGPVPIVTEVLDPDGDLLTDYVYRPTIKEFVIDFILPELAECESDLMSYSDAWNSTYAGRIGQPMASALYSRIMIYMASPMYTESNDITAAFGTSGVTWEEAADAAKSFINNYGDLFSLVSTTTGGLSAYDNMWALTTYTGSNTETIFFRNDPVIYWASIMYDTPVGEGGNGGLCPSQNLIDMYDMADGSAPFSSYDVTGAPVYDSNGNPTINTASGYTDQTMWENRDPRLASTVLYHGVEWNSRTINVISGQSDNDPNDANSTPTGYYVRKYIPETILASEHGGSAYRLWIIQRYAEILLNYAEALNEAKGPTSQVCDLLDMVRQRGGITGLVEDRSDLTTKDAMRNFIHKERTIELAFEEHRWWDVRRWGCAEEALGRDIYGVDVASDGTISRKVAQNRVFSTKMYLYPIPEAEYWKTGIENNPGW